MKSLSKKHLLLFQFFSFFIFTTISYSCLTANATENSKSNTTENTTRSVSEKAKKYWYDGTAEISSFKLKQARYGEIHEGTTTLVYVTEPFSKTSNTKADYANPNNTPVLKLNTTKKFTTGIYPYSMMTSTFFPFEGENQSVKISSSMQEWCGMSYLEMKNDTQLNFSLHSYFEGVSFNDKKITPTLLEDDLWSLIRLNPELLPLENHEVIPSMFYLTSLHKEIKAYKAILSKEKNGDVINYTIQYPELNRKVVINFETKFPNKIMGWTETYESGFGKSKKTLTTKATRLNSLKVDYWNKKTNKDKYLRDSLGLN